MPKIVASVSHFCFAWRGRGSHARPRCQHHFCHTSVLLTLMCCLTAFSEAQNVEGKFTLSAPVTGRAEAIP